MANHRVEPSPSLADTRIDASARHFTTPDRHSTGIGSGADPSGFGWSSFLRLRLFFVASGSSVSSDVRLSWGVVGCLGRLRLLSVSGGVIECGGFPGRRRNCDVQLYGALLDCWGGFFCSVSIEPTDLCDARKWLTRSILFLGVYAGKGHEKNNNLYRAANGFKRRSPLKCIGHHFYISIWGPLQ